MSSDESSTQFTFPGGRSGFYSLFPTGNSSPATSDKKKQWSLEVKNGKLRFFLDNVETTVLNAEPFSEHPFLAIQGLLSNSHTFSNLVLQKHGDDGGVPVSRNVRMLGASMLGWSSEYSRSPLPDGPTDAALKTGLISSVGWQYRLPPASQDKPWKYENNTLEAFVPDKKNAPNWNCYHYQRPLDRGDTWKYEFWWEPGKSVVMPVIGRAVIHLDGERLEREWLMDGLDAHWLSIETGKRVAITGSNRPPLNAEAWNAIELRRNGNDVSILLNGQAAGKFEIEPNQQSYPGLYIPAGVGKFSVRSMTLEGDWPSSLPSDLWECRSAW